MIRANAVIFEDRIIVTATAEYINLGSQGGYTPIFKYIYIDTDDTFTGDGPSFDIIYHSEFSFATSQLYYEIPLSELAISPDNKLLFIWISISPPFPPEACQKYSEFVLAVAYDNRAIYNQLMDLANKTLSEKCDSRSKSALMDLLLKQRLLDESIEGGYYDEAITYWNKYFNKEDLYKDLKRCDYYDAL